VSRESSALRLHSSRSESSAAGHVLCKTTSAKQSATPLNASFFPIRHTRPRHNIGWLTRNQGQITQLQPDPIVQQSLEIILVTIGTEIAELESALPSNNPQ